MIGRADGTFASEHFRGHPRVSFYELAPPSTIEYRIAHRCFPGAAVNRTLEQHILNPAKRAIGRLLSALAAMILMTAVGVPQGRWCALEGVVIDQEGLALPNATVTLTRVHQGSVRSILTDQAGRYRISFLEPGEYTLSARAEGLTTTKPIRVVLELNRLSRVELRVPIKGLASRVVVVGNAPPLDLSLSGISSLVDGRHIGELPLDGRDYLQLALLHAGVQEAGAQSRGFNTGHGIQLSISGSRPVQNSFFLDGVQVSDQSGSTPGGLDGLNFGVDAIREFSILTSSFSPQQGGAAGGVVQAVTRSGSNDLRGSAYYFHRNDRLDARNFFDPGRKPKFRRHHFGASIGGPILRGRTFFFVNAERLSQTRGNNEIDTTLSKQAKQGDLEQGEVNVDPAIARVLELYPLPNGPVFGNTGLYLFENDLRSRDSFLTSRIDHRLTDADQLFVRYTIADSRRLDETTYGLAQRLNTKRQQSLAVEATHAFSATSIESSRLGVSRTYTANNLTTSQVPGTDVSDLAFLPSSTSVGIIDVPGLSLFPGGTGALDADKAAFNSYQLYQDWSLERGPHSFRLGVAVLRHQLNIDSQSLQSGEYRFASLSDFLTNRPSRFLAQLPGSDTIRGFRQWTFAWYATDTLRLTPRLSLDLGLRHEWTTVPSEVNGKLANLDELTSPELRVGGPLYENPSLRNFGPRIGVAWDVAGNGRTLLRSGYGIFHDQIGLHYLLLAGLRNPPFLLRASIRGVSEGAFPQNGYQELLAAPTLDLRAERIPRDLEQPYVQQWNVTLQQGLGRSASMRLAYVGSRGVHLSTIVEDANLVRPVRLPDGRLYFPEGADTINPHFGQIRNRGFDGSSFYHGLQCELRWRAGQGSDLLASYTFSRSIDDSSTTFAQTESSNSIGIPVLADSRFNRGLSNHDRRHRFTTSLLWSLPSPRGGLPADLLGGWRVSLSAGYASGLPFTATIRYDAARTGTARPDYRGGQRPDLAPGFTGNPVTGDPNGWVLAEAFARPVPGFLGNLGRNTLLGPGYRNADLALIRRFHVSALGDTVFADLRFEFFNLTNHANFDLPEPRRQEVFSADGIPEDLGRITTAAAGREIQIGLRLSF